MSRPLNASKTQPINGGPSFPLSNRIERAAWNCVWLLLGRLIPPPFGHGWRRLLLRLFGAKMGRRSIVYPGVKVWLPRNLEMGANASLGPAVQCYNMVPISIGSRTVISQRAFLCAGDHDVRDPDFQLVASPISIGPDCWIAAEAYVGRGTVIGEGAVLAARGCAVSDIPAWTVWGGNPAKQIGERSVTGRAV